MTRRAQSPGALAAVRSTIVVIVVVAGLAACGGGGGSGGGEQQTEAGPDTLAATETSGGNGEITNESNETNETNGSDETTTDDTDDGGCPADGSGNCTFIIRCPEADYEYSIAGPAAASATIVDARPTVAPDPDAPARSVDDVVDVTVEVEAERVKLTTLCADGITPAEATQPLEATGG